MMKKAWRIYGDIELNPQHICERDLNENDLINESIKMHSIHYVLCPHNFYLNLMASHSFTVFCVRCCAILKLIVRNYSVSGDFAVHYIFSSRVMFAGLSTTACAVESINNKRFWKIDEVFFVFIQGMGGDEIEHKYLGQGGDSFDVMVVKLR